MAMEEFTFGLIPPNFRDGPNPDARDSGLALSEREFGISLRLQTHDSLTFNVRLTHPEWREGLRRIFTVMRRPVVIRNKLTQELEEFRVNIESGVGYRWGKKMEDIKGNSVESAIGAIQRSLEPYRDSHGLEHERHPQRLLLQKILERANV